MGRNQKLRLKKEDQICNGIDTAKLKCHLGQLQIKFRFKGHICHFPHQAAISISTEHVQVPVHNITWFTSTSNELGKYYGA